MIRTLLTLAILVLLVIPVAAQETFTWDPVNLVGNAEREDLEYAFVIDIANTTDAEQIYTLEFLDEMPNNLEWSRSWCTHGFCYAPIFQYINDTLPANTADPDCHIQVGFVFLNEDFEPEVPDTTLYMNVRAFNANQPDDMVETMFTLIIGEGSAVGDVDASQPTSFNLAPVYPNPFNAQATVNFTLPTPGIAELALFDVTGRQVATLSNGFFSAGTHQASLLANELGSGTYFLRLVANQQQMAQRVTLVK